MTGTKPESSKQVPMLPPGRQRSEALLSMVRLYWFVRLRWVIITVTLAVLLLERWLQPEFIRPRALLWLVLGLGVINLVWMGVSRTMLADAGRDDADESVYSRRAARLANAQISVDLLMMTLMLRYTGGVENPLAVCYLFHMAIGSALLPTWNAIAQGAWALTLYGVMIFGEYLGWLTPHHPLLAGVETLTAHQSPQIVFFAFGAVGVGIFGMLYLMLQVMTRVEIRERQLRMVNHALRRSQQAVIDLQARRARFMRTAAHQLKSPLTGIEMLSGLIRDGVVEGDEAVKGTVTKIIRRCREAIRQVAELLTLARMQETDPARNLTAAADVSDVIGTLMPQYSPMAADKNQQITCNIAKNQVLCARVTQRDLEDCLGNLIDNAIKYTPDGGQVQIDVERADQKIIIRVSDTGIGISEECPDNLFDDFRRGNQALTAGIPGTGLGLSIVREVVEQANGRVTISARPGGGTIFTVALPAATSPQRVAYRDTRNSTAIADEPAISGSKTANRS